jgi:hypothetical protein
LSRKSGKATSHARFKAVLIYFLKLPDTEVDGGGDLARIDQRALILSVAAIVTAAQAMPSSAA